MLLHQLPAEPQALRVRIWRRLQALGALQLKSALYLLPATDEAAEDFAWLAREIRAGGAEATIWRSKPHEGISDAEIVARFQAMAQAEYEEIEACARTLLQGNSAAKLDDDAQRALRRLRQRFADVGQRDFFQAPRREVAGALLEQL